MASQRAEAAAQGCVPQSPGSNTYICISPADTVTITQGINTGANSPPLVITTDPGFSIKTASGDAIDINATGSFADDATSSIIGARNGVVFGGTVGTGAMGVTASGTITGLNGYGISLTGGIGGPIAQTLTINTGAKISGSIDAVYVLSQSGGNIDVVVQQWTSATSVSAAEAATASNSTQTYFNGAGCAKTGGFADIDPGPDAQGAINVGRTVTNYDALTI